MLAMVRESLITQCVSYNLVVELGTAVESYCLEYLGSVHTCPTYMWAVTTVRIVESILVDPSCMHARINSSCHKEDGGQPVRSPGFRQQPDRDTFVFGNPNTPDFGSSAKISIFNRQDQENTNYTIAPHMN